VCRTPVIGAVQTVDWERATVFQVSFMSMLPHIETVNNVSTFSTISTGEEEAWCGCREIYQDVDPENTPPVVVIIPRLGPDGSTSIVYWLPGSNSIPTSLPFASVTLNLIASSGAGAPWFPRGPDGMAQPP